LDRSLRIVVRQPMRNRQQYGEIAELAVDAGGSCQPVISGDRRLAVAVLGKQFGCLERGQQAVAAAFLRELSKQPRRVSGLALAHQCKARGIPPGLRTALGGLVAAPSGDRPRDNEHKHDADNDVLAVARPKLEEVFAAQLLVDFTKNVAHKSSELPCLPRGYHIR